ncbi:putative transcription factor bHLH041 [Salvia splendens]|uniref:putative transcription factor bHLH041 n=1 Tax=Salvia splendens TaxID=180675 RepID=UPI001C27C8F0|nr:putative transcription factor bHLH041 [Salvia splendens]
MESIFLLGEDQRAAFLRHTMQSFPSTTYICLWSYSSLPSSCLLFLDGFYDEEKIGNLAATRLFNAYCGSIKYVDNLQRLPGLASMNNVPYMEVDVDYLLTTMLITSENAAQMQFYQVAGIKTVVFMGCAAGEIELGFSTKPPVNLQSEIQSRFYLHFLEQIPSSSSSSSVDIPFISSTHHSLIQTEEQQVTPPPSAFTRYQPGLIVASTHRNSNSLFTRSLSFFTNLNTRNSLQMHHAITERRRRQKLNHSFQILRDLVPQVSKKDNASLLSETTEYLRSLRSQLGELEARNDLLEMQLSTAPREELGSSSQRVSVEIKRMAPSSTSQPRFLDLRISLRSRECSLSDLVARVLGLLKQQERNVSLLSLQSNTRFVESLPVHGLVLRCKVEGEEFDESGFQEAVRRVVDDM